MTHHLKSMSLHYCCLSKTYSSNGKCASLHRFQIVLGKYGPRALFCCRTAHRMILWMRYLNLPWDSKYSNDFCPNSADSYCSRMDTRLDKFAPSDKFGWLFVFSESLSRQCLLRQQPGFLWLINYVFSPKYQFRQPSG